MSWLNFRHIIVLSETKKKKKRKEKSYGYIGINALHKQCNTKCILVSDQWSIYYSDNEQKVMCIQYANDLLVKRCCNKSQLKVVDCRTDTCYGAFHDVHHYFQYLNMFIVHEWKEVIQFVCPFILYLFFWFSARPYFICVLCQTSNR